MLAAAGLAFLEQIGCNTSSFSWQLANDGGGQGQGRGGGVQSHGGHISANNMCSSSVTHSTYTAVSATSQKSSDVIHQTQNTQKHTWKI